MKAIVTTFLLLILCLSQSTASVFRVELDGTGDFTNIQPAVDASASGDTVMIGPGRWDTLFEYQAQGWLDSVIVAVDDKDLTLIGSGPGETIIGLTELPPTGNPGPIGIMVGSDINLIVKDLTIENMRAGLYFWGAELQVKNVHLKRNWMGVLPWAIHGSTFQNCLFENEDYGMFVGSRATGLIVRDCVFSELTSLHISIQAVENVLIEGCEFTGGSGSVQFDFGSRGVIKDCIDYDWHRTQFLCLSGSEMSLFNNRHFSGEAHLQSGPGSLIAGSNNQFLELDEDDGIYTLYTIGGILDLHESHIFKSHAEYTVFNMTLNLPDIRYQHMENNYWGTAELDSIEAWIWNEDDDPDLNVKTYLEPFYDHPIPNKKSSMGKMKSLFR